MNVDTWDERSKKGFAVEHEVLQNIVAPEHPKAYVVEGYEHRWDIVCEGHDDCKKFGTHPNEPWTWEVKFDEMSMETGNLGFEIADGDKPSGIARTQATFWIHVTPIAYLIFPTQALREELMNLYSKEVYGGDNKRITMWLVAKSAIKSLGYMKVMKRV